LVPELDLVEMDDQYTHEIDLAADLDTEDGLSTFGSFSLPLIRSYSLFVMD
jgi:hypothetical protein